MIGFADLLVVLLGAHGHAVDGHFHFLIVDGDVFLLGEGHQEHLGTQGFEGFLLGFFALFFLSLVLAEVVEAHALELHGLFLHLSLIHISFSPVSSTHTSVGATRASSS